MHINHKAGPAFVIMLLSLGFGPCYNPDDFRDFAPEDSGAPAAVPSSCTDGKLNGMETDLDCGGPACSPCQDGRQCALAVDCSSQSCKNGICQAISCQDGVQNGTETDADCGGASCTGCGVGLLCNVDADCAAKSCASGKCAAPTCSNGKRDGDETSVDCGGSCAPCTASCSDKKKNGGETDVDCGGGSCPSCAVTSSCLLNRDCNTGVCSAGQCVAKKNCNQILQANPSAQTGVFMIDPVQSGGSTPFAAFCNMTAEGGGWTLVLSYNHAGGTNPNLVSGTRPLDPNNGFSHYSTPQLAQSVFTEVRFYCQTSLHTRVIHFRTSTAGAIAFLKGAGSNDVRFWDSGSGFTALTGHTANLPAATDAVFNLANTEMTEFPFYKGFQYHWGIKGQGNRWECDDFSNDFAGTTLHQIWIR